MKMKVRVFIIGSNGIRKEYGDPITVLPSEISSGYENIMHRVVGATVLSNEKEVGVEILAGNEKRKIIIGKEKIRDRLWWEIVGLID